MGKIDKEKLLKEFPAFLYGEEVPKEIKRYVENFPEEPEQPINFDALYEECGKDSMAKAFVNFLKSKNLTHPQIDIDKLRHEVYSEIVKPKFEIPVNKTWTLKKEVEEKQHCTQCEIGQQNIELIAEVERLKGEKQIILNRIKKFMADHYAEREKDFDKGCALAYAVCVLELERTPEEIQKLLDNEVTK